MINFDISQSNAKNVKQTYPCPFVNPVFEEFYFLCHSSFPCTIFGNFLTPRESTEDVKATLCVHVILIRNVM